MSDGKAGWTDFLRAQGSDYLVWLQQTRVLSTKFDALAAALWTLVKGDIRTPQDACEVWQAVPAVLSRCNEQSTYELRGATTAYAWLHLLDRYARTWSALEKLVAAGCLPMGKHGVRTLDVGTGPGPSAFAIHDFYAAMTEFGTLTGNVKWRQPPYLTCVEFDGSTNHFRHLLAEILFDQSEQQSIGVLSMCHALSDFRAVEPKGERERYQEALCWEEDAYFDEMANEWTGERRYSANEANDIAQALHRYRLVVFSNFLTTVGSVASFERNLVDVLSDAQPGSVVMLLGGKQNPYPQVYEYVDRLARASGFRLKIKGKRVSSSDTPVADRIFTEGARIYEHLQGLAPKAADETAEARMVQSHYAGSRQAAPSSLLWVYRRYRWPRIK